MPPRKAANSFSLRPAIGHTRPRSVISPVMARSRRTGMPVITDTIAVAMATPAEGPSFGVAPSGTCTLDVALVKQGRLNAEGERAHAHVRRRRRDQFLHHVAQVASHHNLSLADFITNIAESDFRYTQGRMRPSLALSKPGSCAIEARRDRGCELDAHRFGARDQLLRIGNVGRRDLVHHLLHLLHIRRSASQAALCLGRNHD